MLINNSIRGRAENHGGELGQRVRSNGSRLFESCPMKLRKLHSAPYPSRINITLDNVIYREGIENFSEYCQYANDSLRRTEKIIGIGEKRF